jgi:hypothetical protein
MLGMEMVPKTLVSLGHLMWLIAQEDFIKFGHCESFKLYMPSLFINMSFPLLDVDSLTALNTERLMVR